MQVCYVQVCYEGKGEHCVQYRGKRHGRPGREGENKDTRLGHLQMVHLAMTAGKGICR